MRKKKVFYLIICLLCVLLSKNDIYPQDVTVTPEPSIISPAEAKETQNSSDPEKLIHYGDVIDVDIIGSTEYDWRGRINPEGFLDGLDFIEAAVPALCRTEEQVAAAIAKGYSKLLRSPQVKVTIIDKSGRPNTFLYGAVRTPHRFLLQRPAYLNELIILAGGITDKSSGEIQILRPSKLNCSPISNDISTTDSQMLSQKVSTAEAAGSEATTFNIKIADLLKGEKDSNPLIVNGDIITVLEATPVYIIGGVLNPKPINITPKMTVSRAIASVGGLTEKADPKSVAIFRRTAEGTKIIRINLNEIKAEKSEDIVLQKFDIIEVEQNGSDKRKTPPVLVNENSEKKSPELPLRIIR